MKSEDLLKETLEKEGLPVKPYEYKGAKPEYIVYNEEDERGCAHRDDRPGGISVWWQVHIFTSAGSDYRGVKRQVRALLLDAGFGVGAVRTLYEKETETVHVVISCNIIEDMED